MNKACLLLLVCLFCSLLAACESGHNYAPVTDVSGIEAIPKAGKHTVAKGESVYEIAWRYGLDYRYLAARNQIRAPYAIHPGQIIYLREQAETTLVKKESQPPRTAAPKLQASRTPASSQMLAPAPVTLVLPRLANAKWLWPAKGKVIGAFSGLNKGVDISGKRGQPIYAAAAGKVVYCGNGLRGYGNLIILKHDNVYLSAYAHNRAVFVREGEWIKQGQKIAEMGNTGSDKVMLHFEIRRAGKPIDPVSLYH